MTDDHANEEAGASHVFEDMVRAVFVACQILAFLFLGAVTIGSIGIASSPGPPAMDTVVPAIGFDDLALFTLGAIAALVGMIVSVRLWLRGSWHVVTVAVLTTLGMMALAYGFAITNFRY